MTDSDRQANAETPNDSEAQPPKRGGRRRRWLLIAAIPAVLGSLFLLPRALAWTGWSPHGFGGFHGLHGLHGFHGKHCHLSEEHLREHIDGHLAFVLRQLEATEEQEEAIRQVVEQSIPDMVALHAEGRALREQFSQALLGPDVDYQQLQGIREQIRELADQASDLAVQRLGAISEVLEEEQRAKILEFIQAVH